MRIGQGFDVHPFTDEPSRSLVLGGVHIPSPRGLKGHSDADPVAHALADAVLGGAGLGDLGRHFPDTDPSWAGVDSLVILAGAVEKAKGKGYRPLNGDCTIVADSPVLSPYIGAMVDALTGALAAPVNVKATRAEGLGSIGRVEGIACLAVVLLGELDGSVSSSR